MPGPPYRIDWLPAARADVRRIDRPTAMRIFDTVRHFSETGGGDVAPLHGDLSGGFRLRSGDHRVLFELKGNFMQVYAVRHRSEVYR